MGQEIRSFGLSQGRDSTPLVLRVRQFEPPVEPDEAARDDKEVGGKGRRYYIIPWAIANLNEAIRAIQTFIDNSLQAYLDAVIDDSSGMVSLVFAEARRLAYGPNPVSLHQPGAVLLHEALTG